MSTKSSIQATCLPIKGEFWIAMLGPHCSELHEREVLLPTPKRNLGRFASRENSVDLRANLKVWAGPMGYRRQNATAHTNGLRASLK